MKSAKQATPNWRLRAARVARGWSQASVAERLETDPFTVGRWERGVTAPSLHYSQRLQALFGLGSADLGIAPLAGLGPQVDLASTATMSAAASSAAEEPRVAHERERERLAYADRVVADACATIPTRRSNASTILSHFRQERSAVLAQPLETLALLPAQVPLSPAGSHPEDAEPATETTIRLLPSRPRHFLGRSEALHTVLHALETNPPGQVFDISGLPGIGKSALASEVVYHLSSHPDGTNRFPNGILRLSGQGLQGEAGLIALLEEILASFGTESSPGACSDLQALVGQTDATLRGKRLLLLLDDLDSGFPLAAARRVLLKQQAAAKHGLVGCSLLITSRLVLDPGLAEGNLALGPLDPDAAMELLTLLVGYPFPVEERASAQQFCALVGYVPLAIEWGAHVLSLGLSAAMLVTHFRQVAAACEDEGGWYARFVQAVAALPADLQMRLARLAPLGTRPFRVEEAALMHLPEATWTSAAPKPSPEQLLQLLSPAEAPRRADAEQHRSSPEIIAPVLAATAIDLLRLAEHSLILPEHPGSGRFRMPPLLQAVAADLERQQYAEAFALAEQYPMRLPEALQPQVLAALAHAWYSHNYPRVLELAYSLYRNTSRLPAWQGKQILQWGLAASQALHDRYYHMRFLSRLGKLHLFQGDFATAERLEEEAMTLAQPLLRQAASSHVSFLLIPWVHRTLIAGYQEGLEETERRVWVLLHQSEDVGSVEDVAAAYVKLAFYYRLTGKLDRAATMCEIAASIARAQPPSLTTLAELALEQGRLAGDEAQIAQALKQILEGVGDPQAHADVVYDQAQYALSRGQQEEARAYGVQSLHLAQHAGAPVVVKQSRDLLLQLPT